jgi:peptidyl-Lys metalloendopeptidase
VSKAYNFTFPGAGLYTFEAHNLFYYINTSAAIPIYAHTLAHESFISGRLVVRGANLVFSAKLAAAPTFFGCNDHQKAALSTAISDATTYLQSALQFVTCQ